MQLVKYKQQPSAIILKNLLPEESKIIQRALATKVKDIRPLQAVNELAATFTTAYTIAGQQADPVTLALYVDEFYSKVMETYPRVTIEEIKAAIRSGVYGEYGDFYGLNPKTFIAFLRSYLQSEQRKEAKVKFEKTVFNDIKPTDEEIEKSNQDFANTLYQDFLNDQTMKVEYMPAFIHDFLVSKELIQLSNKTKGRHYRQAGYYLKQEAGQEGLAALFSRLKKSLSPNDNETRQTVIAKQFAVCDYFELCKVFNAETIF